MGSWIGRQFRQHPWATTAISLYLLLSGVETARYLVIADLVGNHDAGFSGWRQALDAEAGAILYRQAGAHSTLVRPVHGAVLGLLLIHDRSEAPAGPPQVAFAVNGSPLDAYTLSGDGNYTFRYYLPPILGEATWSEVEATLARRKGAVGAARYDENVRWQELRPWRPLPEPPSVSVETTLTVPGEGTAEGSPRVGVGSVEWLDELPPDGAGFHAPESGADGIEYRWSRHWAALPLSVGGREAVIKIRAIHPDIRRRPVAVDFFWGAEPLRRVALSTSDWTDVSVLLPAAARDGVLSLHVSRTWSPARAGVSEDVRELGVAVAAVTWR